MKLADLLLAVPNATLQAASLAEAEIAAIVYDSREAAPGTLFVARYEKNYHTDGHQYVATALAQGATAAVVLPDFAAAHPDLPLISVPNTSAALADFAAAFYGNPARKLRTIGVTGTDGKTTTTFLISRVLEEAGFSTGLFGTVSFKVGPRLWDNPTRETTPEATEVQGLLAEMVAEGVQYAVLESSSHGLAQHRLDHCEYDVAVLTNVTHEHLDFHGSVEQYRLDKAILFDFLGSSADKGIGKVGVVNGDDPHAQLYLDRVPQGGRRLTYAIHNQQADVRASNIQAHPAGLRYDVSTPVGSIHLDLKLTGSFNVYNSLAALTVALSQDIPLAVIKRGLESVAGVAGRMEQIVAGQPFTCIVDYAHTPDAMDKVLGILRPLTKAEGRDGKLICVFGSAGERDRAKRPMQGGVAAKWCDSFVIADEDPRFEEPMAIINEIAVGAEAVGKVAGRDFLKIADRREAIRAAFGLVAQAGDIVVLLGKGHEQCIIVGNEKLPWDDRTVARELLEQSYGSR